MVQPVTFGIMSQAFVEPDSSWHGRTALANTVCHKTPAVITCAQFNSVNQWSLATVASQL
jgi:hypothetical protein